MEKDNLKEYGLYYEKLQDEDFLYKEIKDNKKDSDDHREADMTKINQELSAINVKLEVLAKPA